MAGRFSLGDRVRIKQGIDRGKIGTIIHVGGDDGTYYGLTIPGVMADGLGYSDYELEMSEPASSFWDKYREPNPEATTGTT